MTVIEQLVQIVHKLGTEEQLRLLDLATKLRDARQLPDISPPALASTRRHGTPGVHGYVTAARSCSRRRSGVSSPWGSSTSTGTC